MAVGADKGKADAKPKEAPRLPKVGDKVETFAAKSKDKYNKRTAGVKGLLTKFIKVIMLDGPAKGEKRKFPYDSVKVIANDSVAKKLAKDPGASGPSAAPSAAPAAQASTSAAPAAQASTTAALTLPMSAEAANEKTAPDVCKTLFGNLSAFD